MTILITGAAGIVGTGLRRELAPDRLKLRLLDRQLISGLSDNEESVVGDIADRAALRRAMQGVRAVVHLAGCTTDADIEAQIDGNVRGAFNVFDAAREAGVERVVFASSHHVVGYYPRTRRIGTGVLLRPDSRYGLTKAFGEQAGAMYADKHGLRVLCIRIGYADDRPADRRRLSIWVSWRDLAQLVRIGLSHPQLRYAVVYGVSNNTRGFFDNEAAFRLGYRPMDDAEVHAAELLATVPAEDPALVGTHAMGGWAANNEYVGAVERIHEW
ncbi:NAD-dependent epimerase/dehydratase family protein [Variovorax sp. LjRoot178]|uniref:NAD-dependent epimerase/dehydratase family protein n=1 Tax=Variovorax sp. LjRoot178 TaxID=3342277 RepID=UPI003ECC3DD5